MALTLREVCGLTTEAIAAAFLTAVPTLAQRIVRAKAKIREARMKGYTGDACDSCGSMSVVRNGTCTKCVDCGSTSGCS